MLSRGGGEPAVDAFSAWRPRCAGQAPCIGLPICIGKALYARVLGSARGGTQLCANACGKGTDDAPTGIGGCAAGKGIFAGVSVDIKELFHSITQKKKYIELKVLMAHTTS